MLTDQKLPGYRFPLSVIGHAIWLYRRYALRYRDVKELLLFERGIDISREQIHICRRGISMKCTWSWLG